MLLACLPPYKCPPFSFCPPLTSLLLSLPWPCPLPLPPLADKELREVWELLEQRYKMAAKQ